MSMPANDDTVDEWLDRVQGVRKAINVTADLVLGPLQMSGTVETPPRANPLPSPGGGGTSDGMDGWQTSVETRLGDLHGDVRGLLYGLIGGFLFLLAAFGSGYALLSSQIASGNERIVGKLDGLTSQLGALRTDVAVLQNPRGAATDPPMGR